MGLSYISDTDQLSDFDQLVKLLELLFSYL